MYQCQDFVRSQHFHVYCKKIDSSHSLTMEDESRSPQFGSPIAGFHNTLSSNHGLSNSSFGTFGMNSKSSSFQALALEHQPGQVAASASTSPSNDICAPKDLLLNTFRQSSNNPAQQNCKEPPQKVLLPKLVAQRKTVEPSTTNFKFTLTSGDFAGTPSYFDVGYTPFRLRQSSNNVTQEKGKQPPPVALLPTPVAQMVGISPAPVPQMVRPSPAPVPQMVGTSPAPVPQMVGPSPAPVPQMVGTSPAPGAQMVGTSPAPGAQMVGLSLTQFEFTLTSSDFSAPASYFNLIYKPFRLTQSSNNVTQQKAKQPPQVALLPTPVAQILGPPPPPAPVAHAVGSPPAAPVAHAVGLPPAPVAHPVGSPPAPFTECTLTSGDGPSYQGKRKLEQCKAIDSPILRAQMGPEIVQSIHLPRRKRGRGTTQLNAPSNPYHNVIRRHEYSSLFEAITKWNYDIKNDPQYIKFQELTLDYQINQVITFQTLTPEERRIHWQLVHDTMSHMREFDPECEVYGFGSLITGFKSYSYSPAFQSVDLEFSVALSPDFNHTSPEVILNELVDCEYTFPHHQKSKNINVIKLKHIHSNLTCELSFQGRLPKHDTSMLIKYCLELSIEIRSFFAVLRYWAMAHQIMGNEPNNLSEYTVFMLGFVYLTEDRKLVQPVNILVAEDIIKNTIISSTNTTVSNQSEVEVDSKVNADLGQVVIKMLTEFCDKYAKLDFSSMVISPYAGEIIPREWFLPGNHKRLPHTLQNVQTSWKELPLESPICVQDPYVLEGSICWDRNKKASERLNNKCLQTYNILSRKEKEPFSLVDLFLGDRQEVKEPSACLIVDAPEKTINCNENVCNDERKIGESAIESEVGIFKPVAGSVNRKRSKKRKGKANVNNNIVVQPNPSILNVLVQPKTILVFSIDGGFVDLYLQAIGGSKILEELSGNLLKSKIFTLWKDFSMSFFNEMITNGLNLSVSSDDPMEKVIQVTYPFWQGRAELIQYGEKNPIEIEKKQSDVIIKYFETMKQEGKGGNNDDKESNVDGVSEFVIPITVDVKNKNKIPTLEIYLKDFGYQSWNDGNITAKESDYKSAVQCISRIFKRAFSLYQTYRIKRHNFQ